LATEHRLTWRQENSLANVTADSAHLVPIPAPPVSQGFSVDILPDGSGISFPRFQIVVRTIVLAVIFIRKVYQDLTMRDFDSTLLGLIGISSGTYLGFKFLEKPK
jgi:hypothetical protein